MPNPFRDRTKALLFESAVRCYKNKSKTFFLPNGSRYAGNSAATMFWRGFDSIGAESWDRASRDTVAYAFWKAGVACRKEQDAREAIAAHTNI